MSIYLNNKDIDQMNKMKYNEFISDISNQYNFEQKIKVIFNHELKREFENILLYTKEQFIDSVKEKIFSILSIKYSNRIYNNKNFVSILSKQIQKLTNKYEKIYSTLIHQFNIFQTEKSKYKFNKNINLSKYYFSNYRKHCINSQNYAIHLCNKGIKNTGKFIRIKNDINNIDYLICENCQKVYMIEIFPNYCLHCKEVYFSTQLNPEEKNTNNTNNTNNNILPATLKNNHCEIIVNNFLYCPLCNKVLYLNLNNNKIECLNNECKNYKNSDISEKTQWKCKNCFQNFNSNYKIYNPLEIKLLSEEINYALNIKIKAKPNKLPCCKNIDLNMIDFYHSQNCDGLIFIGEYNEKIFIICEKCKAINFLEKFIWTCPKCKCRFREIREKEKESNNLYINNTKLLNNNNGKKIYKNKNKEFKNYDVKKIIERKRIFSQEYDYDNENDSYFKNNYNNENYDLNIIRNYNYKNKLNLTNEDNLVYINKSDYKRSRNNKTKLNIQNLSNNIILPINKRISINTLDTNEKNKIRKVSMLNLTTNSFYNEKYNKEKKLKNNKIKQFINIIRTNSNNKKNYNNFSTNNNNKKNWSLEKRSKKYFIAHSGFNKNKIIDKNFNFFEKKSSISKRKRNFTPNLCKIDKDIFKKEKNENILKNISIFSINNEKNEKLKIRNRSPFLMRRIFNITLGDTSLNEIKKNIIKNKNIYKKEKNNDFHHKLKFNAIDEKNKRDNSFNCMNLKNSNKKRKLLISLEKIKNRREDKINKIKSNEREKINIITQRQLKNTNNIHMKKENSKSENKSKENKQNLSKIKKNIKYNIKHKYKSIIKQVEKEIPLKPKDIIEPSKIDISKDIPIINESIKNDKKLYQEIQQKLKNVILKGKLPQFFLENYTVVKKLGEGSFGSIFEVVNNDTNIKYAMKKIIANDIPSLELYQKEFEIVYENKHPNILDIHGICMRCLDKTTYALYVLMDIAERDWEVEINQRAKIKNYYTEKELLKLVKQIVNALYFLQKEKNVAHRDIKPENILLFKNNVCKIADFGEAKKSKENRFKTLRGTEFYMSPILYRNLKIKNDYVKHNPYKSDVFSLGYCIVCATALNFDIIEKIRGKSPLEIKKIFNKYFPRIYSDRFVELIFKMIEEDEDKRIDFIKLKQILNKEF